MNNVSRDFLKDIGNGIFLNDSEMDILKKYKIDPFMCKNVKDLIFKIEEYLFDSYDEVNELEQLSERLQEFNYYKYTNK